MLPLIKRSNHYFVIIIITTLIRLICLHKTLQDNSLLSVQPRSSAVNMTLPAFAAKRRAAAPLLLGTGALRCRSIYPVRTALSSKPTARRC